MKSPTKIAIAASAAALFTTTACASGAAESAGGGKTVEVFSWWTSGSEKAGLDGLVSTFKRACSKYKFENAAVAGGNGTNAKQVLASRLQQSDSPSSFQAHAGAELTAYINAGQIQDLSAKYKQWGLTKVFPESLLKSLTVNGKIYSVPANIHRANVLWSNKKVLAKAGIAKQPQTIKDFIDTLDKLKAAGIRAPLAVGKDWTQLDLLDAVLLSELGPRKFSTMWSKGADWNSPEVSKALADFQKLLTYSSSDRDNLDWTDAEQRLVEGKAAYQLMGDWEVGEFKTDKFTDYGYQPFPGNGNTYQWLADSMVLPTGAKNEAGAECWLKVVGSAAGQKAFNTLKGSIPARLDANPADYPEYQQSAMKDFKADALVASCSHGSACTLGENEAATSAMGKFSSDGNVKALRQALSDAANQSGTH